MTTSHLVRVGRSWVPAEINAPPELFDTLALLDFEFLPAPGDSPPPAFTCSFENNVFRVYGSAFPNPFTAKGIDGAVSSIMAGLVSAYAGEVPENTLCLHAAAFGVGNRGFLVPAVFRSGKSSMMTALASLGANVISDDAIILDTRTGLVDGFGFPLRLRSAFLEHAGSELRAWISDRQVFVGDRYIFLKPQASAPALRLTDVLFLDRQPGHERIGLARAPLKRAVSRLAWHNLARGHFPGHILAGLAKTLENVAIHELSYDSTLAAAEWISANAETLVDTIHGQDVARSVPSDLRFTVQAVGDAIFVSDDETGRILELSESAYVVWRLAQQFSDRAEVLQALETLYEHTSPDLLQESFDQTLPLLVQNGLIASDCADALSPLGQY